MTTDRKSEVVLLARCRLVQLVHRALEQVYANRLESASQAKGLDEAGSSAIAKRVLEAAQFSTAALECPYLNLKRPLAALAASWHVRPGQVVTVDAKPIKRFAAWLDQDGSQPTLWPGTMELTADFYNTLADHAVPMDYRALSALKHSALALDVYTWLAHRLCRVRRASGVRLSWQNLRDQFGQEYANPKDFKKEFRSVMRQALVVYPEARVAEIAGGIQIYPSKPPLAPTQISLSFERRTEKLFVDKPLEN